MIVGQPQLVHYVDQLQDKHVLAQIVANLVDCVERVRRLVHIFEDNFQWHRIRIDVGTCLEEQVHID